jgi:crotonobetainyl-CoA:carnitine CoA-transferase CaiB-like acyl-CoA transferase
VAEWIELMSARSVPCAPVNDIAGALSDPQAVARDALVEYEHPTLGAVRTVESALRLDGPRQMPARAPFLGEHSAEILREVCGYSSERIDEFAAQGVFGQVESTVGEP